jgi:hypothetical protein
MVEIKRRLSWVDFLTPLSEEQLDDLSSCAPTSSGSKRRRRS